MFRTVFWFVTSPSFLKIGLYPLHLASSKGHGEVVDKFIGAGADVNLKGGLVRSMHVWEQLFFSGWSNIWRSHWWGLVRSQSDLRRHGDMWCKGKPKTTRDRGCPARGTCRCRCPCSLPRISLSTHVSNFNIAGHWFRWYFDQKETDPPYQCRWGLDSNDDLCTRTGRYAAIRFILYIHLHGCPFSRVVA